MTIAAVVRAMVAAGATPEMILAAVEAYEGEAQTWQQESSREGRRRKQAGAPTNPRSMGINPRALGINPRSGKEA